MKEDSRQHKIHQTIQQKIEKNNTKIDEKSPEETFNENFQVPNHLLVSKSLKCIRKHTYITIIFYIAFVYSYFFFSKFVLYRVLRKHKDHEFLIDLSLLIVKSQLKNLEATKN